jgi:hypothetical protein
MSNHFLLWQESITYSEFVSFALAIKQSKAHAPCIMSSVDCLAESYFPSHLINGTILGEKFLNIKCEF